MTLATQIEVGVERLDVSAYEVPTDEPESDGTLEWDSTTLVVVEAHAGGSTRAPLHLLHCRTLEVPARRVW